MGKSCAGRIHSPKRLARDRPQFAPRILAGNSGVVDLCATVRWHVRSIANRNEIFVKPNRLLELLRDPVYSAVVVRCTSGAEYVVSGENSWYYNPPYRTLSLVHDARTTIEIDIAFIELLILREATPDLQ